MSILLIVVIILLGNIVQTMNAFRILQLKKTETQIVKNEKEIELLNMVQNTLLENRSLMALKQDRNNALIDSLEKKYSQYTKTTNNEIIKYYEIKNQKTDYSASNDVELNRMLKEYESRLYGS